MVISISVLFSIQPVRAYASSMEYKDQDLTIDHGHVDVFYPFVKSGKFVQGLEYGNVLYNPNRVTITIPASQYREDDLGNSQLPVDYEYGYWFLDESQTDMHVAPYPGWDTGEGHEAIGARTSHDASADIVVSRVSAPENGSILVYSAGALGGSVQSFEKGDKDDTQEQGSRFALPGVIHQDTLSHQHANWIFTAAGTYHLDVKTTITSKENKKSISTATTRYTFIVKDNSGQLYSDEDNVVTELDDYDEASESSSPESNDTEHNGENLDSEDSKNDESSQDQPEDDSHADDEDSHDAPSADTHYSHDDTHEHNEDSHETAAQGFRIKGNRESGSHPHFHSYEYSGLSLYIPQEAMPKGTQNLEWRYVRADEPADGGTTVYAKSLELAAEPAMNDMVVYVRALDNHSQVLAQARAHIAVDDHGVDMRPVVRAIADDRTYKPGETVKFTSKIYNPRVPTDSEGFALSDPVGTVTSIVKKRVWLIKKKGEKDFKKIEIQNDESDEDDFVKHIDSKLDLVADKSMDGAVVRVSLELDDGTLYRNANFDDFCDVVLHIGESAKQDKPAPSQPTSSQPTEKKPQTENKPKPTPHPEDKPAEALKPNMRPVTNTPSPDSATKPASPAENKKEVRKEEKPSYAGNSQSDHVNGQSNNASIASVMHSAPVIPGVNATPQIGSVHAEPEPSIGNSASAQGAMRTVSTGASIAIPHDSAHTTTKAEGASTRLNPKKNASKEQQKKNHQARKADKAKTSSAKKSAHAVQHKVAGAVKRQANWLAISVGIFLTVAICAVAVVLTLAVLNRHKA